MLDARIGELREHLQHSRPSGAGSTKRVKPGVADAAAEEQPMVGGASEIVEYEVGIGDRGIVADEFRRARLAERLGGDDIGRNAHDLARELTRVITESGIAAERKMPGDDCSVRGSNDESTVTPLVLECSCVLKDACTAARGGAGKTERVAQWLQVSCIRVVGCSNVASARDAIA